MHKPKNKFMFEAAGLVKYVPNINYYNNTEVFPITNSP